MRSAPKKQSQRRQKQLRKQRREAEAKGIDEGADYLAALGFDEHYLAQERALGLSQPPQKKHAAFLDEAQREYRAERTGLPSGAEKFYGDGYEEVEIPPPRALPPPIEGELLRVDSALPAWARRTGAGPTRAPAALRRWAGAVRERLARRRQKGQAGNAEMSR